MKRFVLVFLSVVVLAIPAPLLAVPCATGAYSSIVAFGDSLSDNGNADGYGYNVWSDGQVWLTYLADANHLNCTLMDYAFGGATTGDDPVNLNWQVDTYIDSLAGSPVASGTLFTLWAGGNDFLNMEVGDDPVSVIQSAVLNMGIAVTKLIGAGATDILVLNLPDLGSTPLFNSDPVASAQARSITMAYNSYLAQALGGAAGIEGVHIYTLDVFGLLDNIVANPAAYGFDNVTGMKIASPDSTDVFLFYDLIHPTTAAHRLLADAAMAAVAPVPEPATVLLIGTGLLGLAMVRRRNRG